MSKLAAYYIAEAFTAQKRDKRHEDFPPPAPTPSWQASAFLRGYYTGRLTIAATRMAVSEFAGNRNTHGHAERMAAWEQRIQQNDIAPARPGKMKSVWAYALYMAGYVGPVIALGSAVSVGVGMVASGGMAALAGIACTCAINTHQAAGEAFVQTMRSNPNVKMHESHSMTAALRDDMFRRTARGNVILKSGISLAFTALAGPVARLFGGFSNEIVKALLHYTPFGRVIGRELARSIELSILRSTHVSLGGLLANLSIRNGKGPQHIAAAFGAVAATTTAMVGAIRGATAAVFGKAAQMPEEKPPSPTVTAFENAVTDTGKDITDIPMPPPATNAQRPQQPHI
jgi:hypothetical protein